MKRFLALFLIVAMVAGVFVGCGRNDEPEWEQGGNSGNANVEGPAPTQEPTQAPTEAPTEPPAPETEPGYVPSGTASYFYFYDYAANDYIYSDIYTYHYVTGANARYSALDWDFLSDENYQYITYGYDDQYALFIYDYDKDEMERYEEYLESRGFSYMGSESYNEGKSRFYKNNTTGLQFDLFVLYDSYGSPKFIVVEPYLNGTMN